jgi:hypothetical protein
MDPPEQYDDCIIGVTHSFGEGPRITYSYDKVMAKLIVDCGGNAEEALEHFNFNIVGGWSGPQTPIWVEDFSLENWQPDLTDKEDSQSKNGEYEGQDETGE